MSNYAFTLHVSPGCKTNHLNTVRYRDITTDDQKKFIKQILEKSMYDTKKYCDCAHIRYIYEINKVDGLIHAHGTLYNLSIIEKDMFRVNVNRNMGYRITNQRILLLKDITDAEGWERYCQKAQISYSEMDKLVVNSSLSENDSNNNIPSSPATIELLDRININIFKKDN